MGDIDTVIRNFQKAALGKKVAILSKNSLSYALAVHACWQTGRTVVPVNIHDPQKTVDEVLDHTGCMDVLAGPGVQTRFQAGLRLYGVEEMAGRPRGLKTRLFLKNLKGILDNDSDILHTSGSTGAAKAVVHSVSNHYYSALGANQNIPLQKDSVYVATLPFYHIGGFSILMRVLLSGASVAVKVPGSSITQTIREVCGTHLSLVPSQLAGLLEEPRDIKVLQKMQAILLGGSAISGPLIETCYFHRLKIYRTYGLSEMSSQVSTTAKDDSLAHLKTSGRVLAYREVQIGADQEILVRGPTLFRGYLQSGQIRQAPKDGWFGTRDTGFFDPDGYLHVTGRLDNLFQVQGINVYPEEVETHLDAMDGVLSSLVVAIEGRKGPEAAAFVKSRMPIDPGQIQAFLKDRIAKQKIPRHYLPWPQMKGLKPDRKVFARIAQKALDMGRKVP